MAGTILIWHIWVIRDYFFCHMLESSGKASAAVVQQLSDVRTDIFIILASFPDGHKMVAAVPAITIKNRRKLKGEAEKSSL